MADHSEALELLPPRLREIAAVIGLDKTLALATAVGGLRIYVPASVDADHALATAQPNIIPVVGLGISPSADALFVNSVSASGPKRSSLPFRLPNR